MNCIPSLYHPYGETIRHRFTIIGAEFTAADYGLFAIRNKEGTPAVYSAGPIQYTEADGYYFDVAISHDAAEQHLPKGAYEYGFSIYRNATLDAEGRPIDGDVAIPIGKAKLYITEAASREEGLYV